MKSVRLYLKGALVLLILLSFPFSHCVCTSGSIGTVGEERGEPVVHVPVDGQSVGIYAHPRIWLSPAKVKELEAKASSSNPMWVGLEYTNDRHWEDGDYKNAADSPLLLNFTLGYLAGGNSDYLSAAKTVLANFPAKYDISCDGTQWCGNDNLDYGSIVLAHLAASYDWLAGKLSDGEKSNIRNWVFEKLIPFLRKHSYYGDPLHNLGHTKWIGEFLWALATLGDDSRAEPLFQEQFDFWKNEISPIFDKYYPGGHTYGGSGYGYNRSFKYALYGMEALTTATTVNGYEGHSWAVDGISYRIHAVLPSQDLFHSDWESAEALFNEGRMDENEALLVQRFKGTAEAKIGQYFLNEVFRLRAFSGQGGNRVNPYYVGLWFLWYDPANEQTSYFSDPTAYVASGLGVGFSRTSWSDTGSAWASFSSSSYVGDHQLHNEGSFKIWKNGEYLVIENGRVYAANSGDTTPTDANILFLGDGNVGQWSPSITGGLPRRGDTNVAGISKFSQGSSYAYFVGDLSTAYHPTKFPLNYFHRIFTHFRAASGSSNDYFVVADRIESVNSVTKKSYIYLPKAPTLAAPDATMVGSNARLQLRSVLPAGATVTSESVTPKTDGSLSQEGSDQPSRVGIATAAGTREFFLTVLQAGAASSTMPDTETIASAGLSGVLIKESTLNRALVVSADTSTLSGTVSFSCHPAGTTEFVVGDLPANQKYQVSSTNSSGELTVTLTPSDAGSTQADAQGVLRFTI